MSWPTARSFVTARISRSTNIDLFHERWHPRGAAHFATTQTKHARRAAGHTHAIHGYAEVGGRRRVVRRNAVHETTSHGASLALVETITRADRLHNEATIIARRSRGKSIIANRSRDRFLIRGAGSSNTLRGLKVAVHGNQLVATEHESSTAVPSCATTTIDRGTCSGRTRLGEHSGRVKEVKQRGGYAGEDYGGCGTRRNGLGTVRGDGGVFNFPYNKIISCTRKSDGIQNRINSTLLCRPQQQAYRDALNRTE